MNAWRAAAFWSIGAGQLPGRNHTPDAPALLTGVLPAKHNDRLRPRVSCQGVDAVQASRPPAPRAVAATGYTLERRNSRAHEPCPAHLTVQRAASAMNEELTRTLSAIRQRLDVIGVRL